MRTGGVPWRGGRLAGTFLVFSCSLAACSAPAQDSELRKTRSIAEAQHNIVMILIEKKEFAKAAEEANKIFQMKWPDDQEKVLKEELLRFSDLFRHNRQPELAVQLLEKNLNVLKSAKFKAEVLKDEGYLLEGLGKHDKALECFREAKRLEGQDASPPTPIKKKQY